ITSGDSGLYPQGLIVGQVVAIQRDIHGKVLTCHVQPAADFQDLGYVFVLLEEDHAS
ncbi:MAG: rod shape-determining protein MreC, partial [Clostridiaceae bacterium]|nr:rod shape-determining protein MreC [Clostridiaceae bacterium]